MENASRALYIVVGVILGLLLMAVMVYVFRQGARVNAAYDQKQITNQLEAYNARFEQFDRDNNNIMDVISLCNAAYDANVLCEFDPTIAINVEIKIGSDLFKIPADNSLSGKNMVLNTENQEKSIYNLAESTLTELGINNFGAIGAGAKGTDKLSKTNLIDNKTQYKYLFKVESVNDFEYHESNMKVSRVKLTAYVNPDYTE